MELDELKHKLKQEMGSRSAQRSDAEISSLLKNDAISIVQKLKGSLVAELIVSILFMAVCCYMMFWNNYWIYRFIFTTFSIMGIAFISVLYVLLKKTNKLAVITTVKHNLEKLINVLEEFVKRYLQLTLILLPMCFVFGVWLSYHDDEKVLKPLAWDTMLYLFAAMMALAGVLYYFTKWYLRKLYGNYLEQLKALLSEISEED